MNKIQHKRMMKWAEYLETVPKKNFDIKCVVKEGSVIADKNDLLFAMKEHTCGTAACAVGYLPIVFPRNWKYSSDPNHCEFTYFEMFGIQHTFTGLTCEEFFDINQGQVDYITSETEYSSKNPSPKTVAARIRKVANENYKSRK